MKFLILKKKRLLKPLLLATAAFIVGCLFVFIPTRASANTFFVVTQLPTQLDKKMSVLSGFVSNDSDNNASVWFEYGKNGRFEESSNKRKIMGTQDFVSRIYSLDPGVLYSYRAVGRKQNSNVIKYGDTKTFIIDSDGSGSFVSSSNSSTQQTDNYSEQTSEQCVVCCQCEQTSESSVMSTASLGKKVETTNTTATLYGVVLTGCVLTRSWFEWGTTISLGRVTPAKKLGSNSRVETKETIYGLSPGTTYYYRNVAVTSAGVNRSAIVSFTTQGERIGEAQKMGKQDSFDGGNTHDQTISDTADKNLTEKDKSKTDNVEISLKEDSLGGVFAWGSSLRGQFFAIDEKGNIDTGVSFDEAETEKQNFLLAGALYSKRFLPNTWSEWGFITIFLYFMISRSHNFWVERKKKREEKKEREAEMRKARNVQLEQTTNGNGVIA